MHRVKHLTSKDGGISDAVVFVKFYTLYVVRRKHVPLSLVNCQCR